MNHNFARKIFYAISTLALLAGIIATMAVARKTGEVVRHANTKRSDYKKLNGLIEQHEKNLALLNLLETASSGQPAPLSSLLARIPFAVKPDVRERGTANVGENFVLHEVEVVFRNAPLKDVARFIHMAESLTMPWKTTEFHATATGNEPGTANVIVVLRTISTADAQDG